MATLLVGDFRSISIKNYYARLAAEKEAEAKANGDTNNEETAEEDNDDTTAFSFLLEDTADFSWLNGSVATQLPLMSMSGNGNHVIIALGFNDCVNSCIWSKFNIDTVAKNYVKLINKLITDYASINFYVCSIGPIDSDYAFTEYKDYIIQKETLTEKIKIFNKKLKQDCEATFIDCYDYLETTSYKTYDGIRYMPDTCLNIANYISGSLKMTSMTSTSGFVPRLESPRVDNDAENDKYWLSTANDGLNPFPKPGVYAKVTGDTLPNCTAYAWGRFYEITGVRPKVSTGNAELWFPYTSDGYERGQTPALGAIICWEGVGSAAGHVAIVEQINNDGSIVTSESGWQSSSYWWTKTRTNSNGNWGAGSGYKFQGFIYCPSVTPSPGAVVSDNVTATGDAMPITKADVIKEDRSLSEAEMQINARYIWNYLGTKGWTLNAVAAMLGNMQSESAINPGRNEVGAGTGYGLVQWTPGTNHKNWARARGYAIDDIDGQLEHIIYEKDNGKQYYKNKFKYTFKEFSVSLDDPYTLAAAFLCDYERAADTGRSAQDKRGKQALKWYEYLLPFAPGFEAEKFVFDNLTIDKLNTTNISASFIVRNGKKCKYKLYKGKNVITSKELKVDFEKEEKKAAKEEKEVKKLHIITFKIEKLIPNTKYKLFVETTSKLGDEKRDITLEFETPQAFPDNVESIQFLCEDEIVTAEGTFSLKVKKPEDLGYWKKNSHGYTIYLLVNNNRVVTSSTEGTKNINKKFTIKNEFGYEAKTGDIVQIGIRTWVKDDDGDKIYNKNNIKTSEAICLLNNSLRIYLNKHIRDQLNYIGKNHKIKKDF